MNKRAVSIIIGTVLLIMIAIVAATSAFYWLSKVQGSIQAGTESSQTELIEQVIGELEIKSFEHNSTSTTAVIIMYNTGSRELKDLGNVGDLMVISNNVHSCNVGFNTTYCDICPFDLGVGAIETLTFNFTDTDCEYLRRGQKYDVYFALGDARVYTSFTADIA